MSVALHAGVFGIFEASPGTVSGKMLDGEALPSSVVSVILTGFELPAMPAYPRIANAAATQLPANSFPQGAIVEAAFAGEAPDLPVFTLSEPYYFPSADLTERPGVLLDIFPDMAILVPDVEPQPAILRLFIDEEGRVDKAALEDSKLSEQAQQFIVKAFTKLKFKPGRIGDMPVKSQMKIEVALESASNS
ncbi:hypothetical protein EGT07_09950 [Herbaspirillum sp. HC18]|nr:hypothetical protein EGT07_09950 [Herbaspirillum sp. HC18]